MREIAPAAAGSLEDLLHRTGEPFLFVDLRGAGRSIVAWPLGHSPAPAPWQRVFDAVLQIEAMATRSRAEEGSVLVTRTGGAAARAGHR